MYKLVDNVRCSICGKVVMCAEYLIEEPKSITAVHICSNHHKQPYEYYTPNGDMFLRLKEGGEIYTKPSGEETYKKVTEDILDKIFNEARRKYERWANL